jgi:hypothetical protein
MAEAPNYHDLYITTGKIKRTRISDLPFGYVVSCERVGGWTLTNWEVDPGGGSIANPPVGARVVIAEEFGRRGLLLDVAGHVICDSLTRDQGSS